MLCKKCGFRSDTDNNYKFCPNCGAANEEVLNSTDNLNDNKQVPNENSISNDSSKKKENDGGVIGTISAVYSGFYYITIIMIFVMIIAPARDGYIEFFFYLLFFGLIFIAPFNLPFIILLIIMQVVSVILSIVAIIKYMDVSKEKRSKSRSFINILNVINVILSILLFFL